MFKRIGIVSNQTRPGVNAALSRTLQFLTEQNADVALADNLPLDEYSGEYRTVPENDVPIDRDLVIAIGGDGTMLRAGMNAFLHDVPVLGINLGRLGFLTDLSPQQIEQGLAAIFAGDFEADQRTVLMCEVVRDGKVTVSLPGLNDVVIQKWNTARLITLDTYIDNGFVHSQRSDGMIISTPTGSTAYALSGGGPIVYPALPAVLLVPICPHSLTNRPIVIADTATIEVLISTDQTDQARVTCDGNPIAEANPGDIVRITKHPQPLRLIHPKGHDHFATLRAKLHWGRAPC